MSSIGHAFANAVRAIEDLESMRKVAQYHEFQPLPAFLSPRYLSDVVLLDSLPDLDGAKPPQLLADNRQVQEPRPDEPREKFNFPDDDLDQVQGVTFREKAAEIGDTDPQGGSAKRKLLECDGELQVRATYEYTFDIELASKTVVNNDLWIEVAVQGFESRVSACLRGKLECDPQGVRSGVAYITECTHNERDPNKSEAPPDSDTWSAVKYSDRC